MYQKISRAYHCLLTVVLFTDFGQAAHESFQDRLGQVLGLSKRDGEDNTYMVSRRQVPMPRIGRSSPSDDTADELFTAIAAMLADPPRDDQRRQPPLPRYGRDSSSAVRELLDLLSSESNSASDDLLLSALENRPSYFRPAPRGGRLKRSLPALDLQDYLAAQGFARRYRAIPFARIGRGNDWSHGAQTKKAVPFARIGRSKSLPEPSSKDNSGGK